MGVRDTTESYNKYMKEYRMQNNIKTNKDKWCSTYRKMTNDVETAWQRYDSTTHCECCGIELVMRRRGNRGAMPGNSKCQDHDHDKNTLRGVICMNCNTVEGHSKTPERAYDVACYMASHTPLMDLIKQATEVK